MKNNQLLIIISVLIISSISFSIAIASPIYVTIHGNQTGQPFIYDYYGYNYINIVFMIDKDKQGTCTTSDGTIQEYDDYYLNSNLIDSFFVDVISVNTTYDVSKWINYSTSDSLGTTSINCAQTNFPNSVFNYDSYIQVNKPGALCINVHEEGQKNCWTDNLTIGHWFGYLELSLFDSDEDIYQQIGSNNMYVVSISNTNPVTTPEPCTFFLLSIGFASVLLKKREF